MGWKGTIKLTRKEAISAIMQALDKTPYDEMTNEQLEDTMSQLKIGDDLELPYYGNNFWVVDTEEEKKE